MRPEDELTITFPGVEPDPKADEMERLMRECLAESLNSIFREAVFITQEKLYFFASGNRTRKRRNQFANWIVNRRSFPRKAARRIANAPFP